MSVKVNEKGEAMITCQGNLTALQVTDLKEVLAGHLKKSNGIILYFENIDSCDSLGIQLLCSANKTADALGKTFLLTGDLDAVFKMAARSGLTPEEYFTFEKRET